MHRIRDADEEDDLESLRLAALQSLKRRNNFPDSSSQYSSNSEVSPNYRNKSPRNKWGRYQRGGKAAHFNRARNTNLISITPVGSESDAGHEKKSETPSNTSSQEEVGCSKFNRYNKSDKSESETEEDDNLSEDNELGKLKKSDSLEALMQELDEEIQGKIKESGATSDIEKPKPKKNKKKRKISEQNLPETQAQNEPNKEVESSAEEITGEVKEVPGEETISIIPEKGVKKFERRNNFNRRPYGAKSPNNRFFHRKRQMFPDMGNPQPPMMFNHPNHFQQPPMMQFMGPQCNPGFLPNNPPIMPPVFFDRPLSPLAINTESLTTATRAPLSPRSAKFVLDNKAIIERRKRSPRRSYSRSLSRSLSRSPPRYSLSPPRRFRRSASPRRFSRSPRRFSPPRKRSLSPRRRSLSPKRETVPNRTAPNRPKTKPDKDEDVKPKEKEKEAIKAEEEEILDPVLLARKRKFETKVINKKEGIIRLKPKDEKPEEVKPVENKAPESKPQEIKPQKIKVESTKSESKVPPKDADKKVPDKKVPDKVIKEEKNATEKTAKEDKTPATSSVPEIKNSKTKASEESQKNDDPLEFQELERLLNDDIALDEIAQPKVVDIFSDEESDSDNEGRFKMKEKRDNVPVLSFSKLINGVKEEVKSEALPDSSRPRRGRDRYSKPTTSVKATEPIRNWLKDKRPAESQAKRQRITLKDEQKPTENKIEIKIKNPAKYEKTEKVKSRVETVSDSSKDFLFLEDEPDPQDDRMEADSDGKDSGDEENMLTEGDLRTQLSRKRAGKLHRIPDDEVSTRILKFALQGAVFKKSKKKSKKKSSHEAKLPIHLRLGLNGSKEIFEEIRVKKKSKKRKNRELLDQ